jgi:hypothetical protein
MMLCLSKPSELKQHSKHAYWGTKTQIHFQQFIEKHKHAKGRSKDWGNKKMEKKKQKQNQTTHHRTLQALTITTLRIVNTVIVRRIR